MGVMADNTIYIEGYILSLEDINTEDYFSNPLRYTTDTDVEYALQDVAWQSPGARNITVVINSPGGCVTAGYAIYNALRDSGYNITVQITGMCASVAAVIAMAGNTIKMDALARFMIHNPYADPDSMSATDAEGLRAIADQLQKYEDEIATVFANKTGKSVDEIKGLMSKETELTAEEALQWGFIDEVTNPIKALAFFKKHTDNEMELNETQKKSLFGAVEILNKIGKKILSKNEATTETPPATTEDTDEVKALKAKEAELAAENERLNKELEALRAASEQAKKDTDEVKATVLNLQNTLKETFGKELNLAGGESADTTIGKTRLQAESKLTSNVKNAAEKRGIKS